MKHLIWDLINRQHQSIEAQRWDENHDRLTREVINDFAPLIPRGRVVDIGCGQGIAKKYWEEHGFEWVGVTLGGDWEAIKNMKCVYAEDMHTLSSVVEAQVVYARHVLEHSPIPVVALRRWMDIAPYIIVVVPTPTVRAVANASHWSVFPKRVWMRYFRFLGLAVLKHDEVPYNNPKPWPQEGAEYRFLLKHGQENFLFYRQPAIRYDVALCGGSPL